MFERKEMLPHVRDAIIDAIAILELVPEAKAQVEPNTTDTLRAIIGFKGKIPQYMNDAIAEQVENERK